MIAMVRRGSQSALYIQSDFKNCEQRMVGSRGGLDVSLRELGYDAGLRVGLKVGFCVGLEVGLWVGLKAGLCVGLEVSLPVGL